MQATAQDRRRNLYATNCCICKAEVLPNSGYLYQDTSSTKLMRDAKYGKKHWKVKCERCHLGISDKPEQTEKKISVNDVKQLIKKHGHRFDVAMVDWCERPQKVVKLDGNIIDSWFGMSYIWLSPESFYCHVTGTKEVESWHFTDKARDILEQFCSDLYDK